jgi:hypothetical protein
MRLDVWTRYPGFRIAVVALAAGIVLVAWTLVRALRVDPVPDVPPPTLASAGAIAAATIPPATDVAAAVEKDPFAPDRSAPASPYRLPGEPDPKVAEPVVEPQKPVVIGTAVSPLGGRSFAVLQLGDARPVSLSIGDRIGAYTVKSIERGRVVFTTPAGKKVDITAVKP